MPQSHKSQTKPTLPLIRPLSGTAQFHKSENYNKCEVPSYGPKGMSDPTYPLASNQTPNYHAPLPEVENLAISKQKHHIKPLSG